MPRSYLPHLSLPSCRRRAAAGLGLFLGIFVAIPDLSAGPTKWLGTHHQWSSHSYSENGGKVCYIASNPIKEEGDYTKRGQVFALVTHRPKHDYVGVVSFIAGYSYEKGSQTTVEIGNASFKLFTEDDKAWAPDNATDKKMVAAMKRGDRMTVKGVSSRGTRTTDTFSLRGFTAAYNQISRECRIKN